jgi:classical protein kinase C
MLAGEKKYNVDLQSRNKIANMIAAGKYEYDDDLSKEANSLLKGLLTKKPEKRLGHGPNGIKDIQNHKFFKNVDWNKMLNKEVTPPIKPKEAITPNLKCVSDLISECKDHKSDIAPNIEVINQQLDNLEQQQENDDIYI